MPLGLLQLLALGFVIGWALMVLTTARLLTRPPRRGYSFAVSRGRPGDPGECLGPSRSWSEWKFRAEGSRVDLSVWDISGDEPDGPTVIVTHGWGDSRVVMLTRLPTLVAHASRVLMWDLPGHNDAPGRCAMGTREVDDLLALVRASKSERVVLYGFSLGAGVSIAAAARLQATCKGVIAEAPYRVPKTPARNMLRLRGLPHAITLEPALALIGLRLGTGLSWAMNGDAGGFDRVLHAARLHPDTRLLVLVGASDPICPMDDARAIAEQGHGELAVIPDGDHTELWSSEVTRASVAQRVSMFLSVAAGSSRPSVHHGAAHDARS